MLFRGCLEGMCGGGRDLLNFTELSGLLLLTTLSFSLWNRHRGIHQLPRDCPVCLVAGNGPAGSEREPAALAPTRGFL